MGHDFALPLQPRIAAAIIEHIQAAGGTGERTAG
jgi:hypothetical protein